MVYIGLLCVTIVTISIFKAIITIMFVKLWVYYVLEGFFRFYASICRFYVLDDVMDFMGLKPPKMIISTNRQWGLNMVEWDLVGYNGMMGFCENEGLTGLTPKMAYCYYFSHIEHDFLSDGFGYGSIPINTIFRGMNIHKSQLF